MNSVVKSVGLNVAGVVFGGVLLRNLLGLPWFLALLAVLNAWLLVLMMKDKMAAEKKKRRTPEATLLILALLGGTPALYFGRWWLRHKTIKPSFNGALLGVVGIQVAFLGWWLFLRA